MNTTKINGLLLCVLFSNLAFGMQDNHALTNNNYEHTLEYDARLLAGIRNAQWLPLEFIDTSHARALKSDNTQEKLKENVEQIIKEFGLDISKSIYTKKEGKLFNDRNCFCPVRFCTNKSSFNGIVKHIQRSHGLLQKKISDIFSRPSDFLEYLNSMQK